MAMKRPANQLIRRIFGSEAVIDALAASLLSAGVCSGLFSLVGLEMPLIILITASLVISGLLMILVRFWRVTVPVISIALLMTLVILISLEAMNRILKPLAAFAAWAWTWLPIGQPEPDSAGWPMMLRILLIFAACMIWLPLTRRGNSPLLTAILLAAIFIPLLIAFPDTLSGLLTAMGGLILQLPRRFLRLVHNEHPHDERLARAPLQFLALPLLLVSLLLANSIVPSDTRGWRWPALVNQVSDIGDLINSQTGFIRSWQPFSISSYGFNSAGVRLGGPAVLSRQNVLRVKSDHPWLLKGSVMSVYTGSSWEISGQRTYRLGNNIWWLLRQRTFGLDLPTGSAGRNFRRQYMQTISIEIKPQTGGQSIVFTAGRLRSCSLSGDINHVAYFSGAGDVFVVGGLPRDFSYTVTADVFDRSQPGFDQALLSAEQDLADGGDNNWSAITAEYLQLPEDLPEFVRQQADLAASGADTPYKKALALEAHFQEGYRYTLQPPSSDSADFVEGFLKSRAGYCVHFATAMVVMARSLGIPARYVEGFTLKRPESSQSGIWVAAGNTAHAWAELYFEGIGWLNFDPTPGSSANDPVTPTPIVTPQPSGVPTTTPGPPVSPTPIPDGSPEDASLVTLGWLAGLASLIFILARLVPWLARRRHYRRFDSWLVSRRYPEPAGRLDFYYRDLLEQLACLDIRPEPGETLLEFASRVDHRLKFDGIDVQEVLWPVISWRYGDVTPQADELSALIALHRRTEDRLLDSMSRLAYLWRRVFKTWRRQDNRI